MRDYYTHSVNELFLNEVDDERVKLRAEHLNDYVFEMDQIHDFPEGVFVNPTALTALVRSYFIDVVRYKHFHDLKLIESYKVAAYTAKWVLRYKPIQFNISDASSPYATLTLGFLKTHSLLKRRYIRSILDLFLRILSHCG